MAGDPDISGAIPVESLQNIGVLNMAKGYMSSTDLQANTGGTEARIVNKLPLSVDLVDSDNSIPNSLSKGTKPSSNMNSRLFAPTQAFLAKSRATSSGHSSKISNPIHTGIADSYNMRDGQDHPYAGESAPVSKYVSSGGQQRGSSVPGVDKLKGMENARVIKPEWDASGRARRRVPESTLDKSAKQNALLNDRRGEKVTSLEDSESVSRLSAPKKVSVTAKSGRSQIRSQSPSPAARRNSLPRNGREELPASGAGSAPFDSKRASRDKLLAGKAVSKSSNAAVKVMGQHKSHDSHSSRSAETRQSDRASLNLRARHSSLERKGRLSNDASDSHSSESRHASFSTERSWDASGHAIADSIKSWQSGESGGDRRGNNLNIGTPRAGGLKGWSASEGKEGNRWDEGENSPVSVLDLVLSDDVISPANSVDGRRHSIGEGNSAGLSGLNSQGRQLEDDCMLELHRQLEEVGGNERRLSMSQSKSSFRDSIESLESVSLDFIGEVEGMEQDLEYVRHILVVSGFGEEKHPPWHSTQLPINPAVFEQLELGIALGANTGKHSMDMMRRNEERRQRMLLFDAVNEALGRRLAPFVKLPPWVSLEKPTIRHRPVGKELLQEVWLEVHDWPVPTSDEVYDILDDAARRDMTRGLEKWVEIGEERAEVVFELEGMILQDLLEEQILEFTAAEEHLRLKKMPLARQRSVGST